MLPLSHPYRALAAQGASVPVSIELPIDFDTPLSVFTKLRTGSRAFILESCVGGERYGRYSFAGSEPIEVVRLDSGGAWIESQAGRVRREGPPLDVLRALWRERAVTALPGEAPFLGGLVGYMGYDAARWFEPSIPDRHVGTDDALGFFESEWMAFEQFVTLDTRTQTMRATAIARPARHASVEDALRSAEESAHSLAARLVRPVDGSVYVGTARGIAVPSDQGIDVRVGWDRDGFARAVERAREYIRAGDCMQVVLARRFETDRQVPPLALYRALRRTNPSPYLFAIEFGDDRAVVGASPELLVRVREGNIVVRPIAGTRPRGRTEAEDLLLERELLADEKERAEHVMLIDLGRNDVGRIATPGSVRVTESMAIERYSHVMHIGSQVEAKLDRGRDALDALASAFPAGTLTGAPKIRAMQIIDELEPVRRGPYGGAVGYLSFGGTMDVAIAIRTAFLGAGRARWMAGAGIVADSVPLTEADETEHKARALTVALEIARREAAR